MKQKPIRNFIRSVKKVGWKETWKQFKYNFVMLETPEQQMKIEIIGFYGSMAGTLFALIYLLFTGLWFITFAVGFSLLIQYGGLKGKLQRRQQFEDVKKMAEGIQEKQEGGN